MLHGCHCLIYSGFACECSQTATLGLLDSRGSWLGDPWYNLMSKTLLESWQYLLTCVSVFLTCPQALLHGNQLQHFCFYMFDNQRYKRKHNSPSKRLAYIYFQPDTCHSSSECDHWFLKPHHNLMQMFACAGYVYCVFLPWACKNWWVNCESLRL